MKSINEFIYESKNQVDNIIIGGSGSMSGDGENIALVLKKTFKSFL